MVPDIVARLAAKMPAMNRPLIPGNFCPTRITNNGTI